MSGPAAAASTSTSTGGTPCGPTPSRKRPSTADHTGPPPPPPHLTGPARSARLGSTPPPTPASTGGPDLRGTSPRSPYPGTGPGDARPGKRTCCPQAPGGRPTRRRREAPDRCAPHPAFRDSLISIQISTEDTRSIQQPPSSAVRPRQALLHGGARRGVPRRVAARLVRLQRRLPADRAAGRDGVVPHPEALLEPDQQVPAPHLLVGGHRRYADLHTLPARGHVQRHVPRLGAGQGRAQLRREGGGDPLAAAFRAR